MKINLSPARWDIELTVVKDGDKLVVNGEVFDFSVIPNNARLPASAISSEFFIGEVVRSNGELELTMRLPHGVNAPEETRFPLPIVMDVDGEVELPPFDTPQPEVPAGPEIEPPEPEPVEIILEDEVIE